MAGRAEGAGLNSTPQGVVAAGEPPWAVYLLSCNGGKCYIGISPQPEQRYAAHQAGRGGAFTRAHRPAALEAIVWFENRGAAAAMEPRLKTLARTSKLEWFRNFPRTTPSRAATLADGLASL